MAEYHIDYPTPDEIATQLEEQLRYGYKPIYRETIVFASGTDYYDLECSGESIKKIHDILKVLGTKDGTEHIFVENVDYSLYDSDFDGFFDQISWVLAGDEPDDDTEFYVDYRHVIAASGLTDFTAGSVTRTILVEAPSILLYGMWLAINNVARDSFIDSADGRELDELGKLVGVIRNEATRTTGYVTLTRPANLTSGVINIPVGSRVSTIGTAVSPSIEFEVMVAAKIDNTNTAAEINDSEHPENGSEWIPVRSVIPGIANNVSSSTVVRNVSASSVITTVNNPPTFDTSDEQISGTGTKQVFILDHPADSSGFVDKDSDNKAIEVRNELIYGWIDQPTGSQVVDITLSSSWNGRATIFGNDGTYDISEIVEFTASSHENSTSQFRWIFYITFSSDTESGIGDRTVTVDSGIAGTRLLTTWGGAGKNVSMVDGGWTALNCNDDAYLKTYINSGSGWTDDSSNWSRQTANIGYDTARTWMKYKTGATDWATDHGADSWVGQRNVKHEYVPESDMHSVDGSRAEFEYAPRKDSYLEVDYTWENLFQDGADTENDTSLRERIKTGITASAKGTGEAIRAAVLAVDGIVGARVDDHSTDNSIAIGEVKVFAWGASGLLTAAKKSEVTAAVEATRAAGISASVHSPTAMYFTVVLTVYVDPDTGSDLTTVEANCESAISTWLDGHDISENLLKSDLIATVSNVTGVLFVDTDTIAVKGYNQVSASSVSTDSPYTGGWSWTAGVFPDGSGNVILIPTGYISKSDNTAPNVISVTATYYNA